jgi:glucose/arabinose dehydrogenase
MRPHFSASLLLALSAAVAVASPPGLFNAFPEVDFDRIVDLQSPPDGSNRLFVVQQSGEVYSVDYDPGATSAKLFLDLADSVTFGGEAGLLGLAFHPDYASNRRFFVSYVAAAPMRQLLVEYLTAVSNSDSVVLSSRRIILESPANTLYHNGGRIVFDTDGYLLYAMGEDTQPLEGQDRTNLLGTMIRIDVDNPSGGLEYGIPSDNPWVGNQLGYREEIYAYGFRNPWRFSVDPATGRIWCGDVGSSVYEEINIVHAGRNYGWPRVEWDQCVYPSTCDTVGLNVAMPLYAYPHGTGAAVVGGHVNNGTHLPSFQGWYLYTDWVSGEIHGILWDGEGAPVDSLLMAAVRPFTCTGLDPDGNVLFGTLNGDVYELREDPASSAPVPAPAPAALIGNRPNPFNPSTIIEYDIHSPASVRVDIFDVRGRALLEVERTHTTPGRYALEWDGRDRRGRELPSGVYFARLVAGGHTVGRLRMVLLK